MSWDEPLAIARRLATHLGAPLTRWPERGGEETSVLLVPGEHLAEIPPQRLASARALLVTGKPGSPTSNELVALRDAVADRGLAITSTSFATVPGVDGTAAEVSLVIAAPASDASVAEVLAAGPLALVLDAAVDVASISSADPPARVCVVSFEISGMTGGGIGTASTSLAETLARAGHDVTFLFTGWQEQDRFERNAHWQRHYAERGVRLEILRERNTVKNPHFPARTSYEVFCWLRREASFDVVHLPENMGHGTYAQLAKRQGTHFAGTTFVIGTHGPTRWAAEANRVALTREEFLVNEALEHTSVALADVLLGPSRYLHDYKRARGWALPARVHVQPYSVPAGVRARGDAELPADVRARVATDGTDATRLPDEIVFFGRLETRKGVATLCDALDRLCDVGDLPSFAVTFLGPIADVLGQPADAYIAARAPRWPWRWQIISDRDQQSAAEYLARPGVLAAMPSTVDNAPNTVSEAVALGIPLVASRTGGTGELIAAEQRDDHMFAAVPGASMLPLPLSSVPPAADAAPLAELLHRRLTTAVEPARAAAPSDAVDAAYDRWHRAVRRANDTGATAHPADDDARALPTLSVCVLFDGDEALLSAQLDALASGDADAEIVVADLREDAGEPVDAAAGHGAAVVRPTRPRHAADARTAAVAATTGELIAIVPPGDLPLPAFADALRAIAATTKADAYSCAVLDELEEREDDGAPAADAAVHAFVPLGGPPLAGITHPAFAVGPYAIRREALAQLGGFAADTRGDETDHELLNRLSASGLRLEIVPEPLAAKRRADRWVTFRAVWPYVTVDPPYDAEQWLRVERPITGGGEATSDLVGLLRGARSEGARLQAALSDQTLVYESRSQEQRTWIADLEVKAEEFRTYQAELLTEIKRLDAETKRLRALNEEMSQSAAQLTVRALRNAGRRAAGRFRS